MNHLNRWASPKLAPLMMALSLALASMTAAASDAVPETKPQTSPVKPEVQVPAGPFAEPQAQKVRYIQYQILLYGPDPVTKKTTLIGESITINDVGMKTGTPDSKKSSLTVVEVQKWPKGSIKIEPEKAVTEPMKESSVQKTVGETKPSSESDAGTAVASKKTGSRWSTWPAQGESRPSIFQNKATPKEEPSTAPVPEAKVCNILDHLIFSWNNRPMVNDQFSLNYNFHIVRNTLDDQSNACKPFEHFDQQGVKNISWDEKNLQWDLPEGYSVKVTLLQDLQKN